MTNRDLYKNLERAFNSTALIPGVKLVLPDKVSDKFTSISSAMAENQEALRAIRAIHTLRQSRLSESQSMMLDSLHDENVKTLKLIDEYLSEESGL